MKRLYSIIRRVSFIMLSLIVITFVILFFEMRSVPPTIKPLIQLCHKEMESERILAYFGEIKKIKRIGYAKNKSRTKKFPGKTIICFIVSGRNKKDKIEFIFNKIDSVWVFEKYEIGACSY